MHIVYAYVRKKAGFYLDQACERELSPPNKKPRFRRAFVWRRERDSNSRTGISRHTISSKRLSYIYYIERLFVILETQLLHALHLLLFIILC